VKGDIILQVISKLMKDSDVYDNSPKVNRPTRCMEEVSGNKQI